MKKVKHSMKFHLLFSVVSLVVVVFSLIFLTFNWLFAQYIERTATETLSVSNSNMIGVRNADSTGDSTGQPPPPAGLNFPANVEQLILDSNYDVLFPANLPSEFQENIGIAAFAAALDNNNADLSEEAIASIEWEDSLYYYTASPSNDLEDSFVVSFINMSNLYTFEQTLNQMLLIIMAIALIIVVIIIYFISARTAEPLQVLAEFAKKIGEGEYKTIEADFTDLELHELKSAMNETSKKLKHYDNEQRTFFQNASHELRTPLQIIKTNAEGIEYGLIDDKTGSALIKNETDKLSNLIEDILLLSRLDAHAADRIDSVNDLRETLSYTAERYAGILHQHGIQVEYDFQDSPVSFKYDERDFERAFQNLLSNALRYSRGIIRLSCKEVGDRIMITIRDNGAGVDPKDLPHLFDRFYTGKDGIHGIGLSIVKTIIQSYDGRVEVQSDPSGTAFTIFLPVSSKSA